MPWADAGPVVCAAHKEFVYMCVSITLSAGLSSTATSHLPVSGHAALRLVLGLGASDKN